MKQDIEVPITLPDGITASKEGHVLTIEGPQGTVEKTITDKRIRISISEDTVTLSFPKASRTLKRLIYTNASRVQNMVYGVEHSYTYKLEICSGHFPMQVSYNNNELTIKNFIGESVPRVLKVDDDVKVSVQGEEITVESADKELAGLTAGRIEDLCKRPGFDERIFQDGIYITQKPQKQVRQR